MGDLSTLAIKQQASKAIYALVTRGTSQEETICP